MAQFDNIIKVEVQNSFSQITSSCPYEFLEALDNELAFGIAGSKFMLEELERKRRRAAEAAGLVYTPEFNANGWDGRNHMFKLRSRSFPTGFIFRVEEIARNHGMALNIIDQRRCPSLGDPLEFKRTLRPHQLEALESLLTGSRGLTRGLLESATGSGKTTIMAALTAALNVKTLVLTCKLDLLHQLRSEFSTMLGQPIGVLGDGVWEPQKITVAMVPSLIKIVDPRINYKKERALSEDMDDDAKSDNIILTKKEEIKDWLRQVSLLISDEVHHMASKWGYKISQSLTSAYWRYGFSATAYGLRADGTDYMNEASMGPVLCRVPAGRLVRDGMLVPVNVYTLQCDHSGHRYGRKSGYTSFYSNAVVANEERNRIILEACCALYNRGANVLVAVLRVGHGKFLEEALCRILGAGKAKFVYGEDTTETRVYYKEALNHKQLPVLISTLMGEGLDMPSLSAAIDVRGVDSQIATVQLLGRVMRLDPNNPNKKSALYIDIADCGERWLESHTESRMTIYERDPDAYRVYPLTSPTQLQTHVL